MKKIVLMSMMLALVLFFTDCKKKEPKVEPPKEQAKVEKVEEVTPKVEKPTLNEEEIFNQKSLDDLNKEGNLKRIHFDFDRYDIREDMTSILQADADWLLAHKTVEIIAEGHCDERGTIEYNIALGEKRAESAKKYLQSLGVPPQRIKIISYGKNRPLVKGIDEQTFYMNRRDEFVITKK